MEHQFEALGQQALEHRHQDVVIHGPIGFGHEVIACGIDPRRSAGNPIRAHSEGAHDAALQGDV